MPLLLVPLSTCTTSFLSIVTEGKLFQFMEQNHATIDNSLKALPTLSYPQFPSLDISFSDKDSVVRTIHRPQQTEPLFGM